MSVFQSARRRPRWRLVLQLYDGRECPECYAIVCGADAKIAHRQRHDSQREQLEMLAEAIRVICQKIGLVTADQVHEPGDGTVTRHQQRVIDSNRWDDDDEDEENDDDDD